MHTTHKLPQFDYPGGRLGLNCETDFLVLTDQFVIVDALLPLACVRLPRRHDLFPMARAHVLHTGLLLRHASSDEEHVGVRVELLNRHVVWVAPTIIDSGQGDGCNK